VNVKPGLTELENSAGEKMEQLSQRHATALDKLISLEKKANEQLDVGNPSE